MTEYKLKTGNVGDTIVGAYKGIEKAFVDTFLNEDGSMKTGGMEKKVAGVCRAIEGAVVGGYRKIEKAFVNTFLEEK